MLEFIFPQPTGQYDVSTKLFDWTDSTRNRELMVQVWYPAKGKPKDLTAPYAYDTLEIFKRGNYTEKQKQALDLIRTHAVPDLIVSREHAPYPVIIFGHGYGCPRGFYSFFCEDIASQGYVVAMVMHTGFSQLIRFADGREVGLDPELLKNAMQTGQDCFTDIEFMLNQAISGAFGNELTSICDFNNIGMIGHSLGGMLAAHICRQDARVKAGISLDGPLEGPPGATTPFHKPFMFMRRSNFYELPEESLQALDVSQDNFVGSIERFCRANGKETIQIVVQGAEHMTFSDEPILTGL